MPGDHAHTHPEPGADDMDAYPDPRTHPHDLPDGYAQPDLLADTQLDPNTYAVRLEPLPGNPVPFPDFIGADRAAHQAVANARALAHPHERPRTHAGSGDHTPLRFVDSDDPAWHRALGRAVDDYAADRERCIGDYTD